MAPIRVGTDFSGLDMPLFALRAMNIDHQHVFSSDNNRACKKLILSIHKPVRFYSNVHTPKTEEDDA